jgi:hypothetical protein
MISIKKFKVFHLNESGKYSSSVMNISGNFILNEDDNTGKKDKVDSYRSIAYKLAEIFSLYGFFFAQKEGFFDPKNWTKLMDQIIQVKDPKTRWELILKMSKFLQSKTASPALKPVMGEFGYKGNYSYGQETEDLPKATEFLKAASDAAFKTFSPEEQKRALEVMDEIIKNVQPLKFSKSSSIQEGVKYLLPTESDLLRTADSSGNKLMNMYNVLDNLKTAYPDSSTEIDSFLNTYIIPNVDKVRSFMQNEIPKVSGAASVGFMKKLQNFDQTIDALIPRTQELRDKIVKTYQPIAASKEFEDSAMAIILKVRQGIMRQAEENARWTKMGDVVAGETDITNPKFSKDLQSRKEAEKVQQAAQAKKRSADDLADFLTKKYTIRN